MVWVRTLRRASFLTQLGMVLGLAWAAGWLAGVAWGAEPPGRRSPSTEVEEVLVELHELEGEWLADPADVRLVEDGEAPRSGEEVLPVRDTDYVVEQDTRAGRREPSDELTEDRVFIGRNPLYTDPDPAARPARRIPDEELSDLEADDTQPAARPGRRRRERRTALTFEAPAGGTGEQAPPPASGSAGIAAVAGPRAQELYEGMGAVLEREQPGAVRGWTAAPRPRATTPPVAVFRPPGVPDSQGRVRSPSEPELEAATTQVRPPPPPPPVARAARRLPRTPPSIPLDLSRRRAATQPVPLVTARANAPVVRWPRREMPPELRMQVTQMAQEGLLLEAAAIYRRYGMDTQARTLERLARERLAAVTETQVAEGGVSYPSGTMSSGGEGGVAFLNFQNGLRAVFKPGQEGVKRFLMNRPDGRALDEATAAAQARVAADEAAELADAQFSQTLGVGLVPVAVPFTFRGVTGTLHYRLTDMVDGDAPVVRGGREETFHRMSPLGWIYNWITGQLDNRVGNTLVFSNPRLRAAMNGQEFLIDRGAAWTTGTGLGPLIWDEIAEWNGHLAQLVSELTRLNLQPSRVTPEVLARNPSLREHWQAIERFFPDLKNQNRADLQEASSRSVEYFYNVLSQLPPERWLSVRASQPQFRKLPVSRALFEHWQGQVRARVRETFASEETGGPAFDLLMNLERRHLEEGTQPHLAPEHAEAAWNRVMLMRQMMQEISPRPEWLQRRWAEWLARRDRQP